MDPARGGKEFCERCGREFHTDGGYAAIDMTKLLNLEAEKEEFDFYLCPDCVREFESFLDGGRE